MINKSILIPIIFILLSACSKEDTAYQDTTTSLYPEMSATFAKTIDFDHLDNYATQTKPNYVNKDNSGASLFVILLKWARYKWRFVICRPDH